MLIKLLWLEQWLACWTFLGGTVDISAHEVIDDESVRELYPANGGPWGGTEVDKKFIILLNELLGEEFVSNFKHDKPATFLHFMTLFEKAKKQICVEEDTKICLQLPWELGRVILCPIYLCHFKLINNFCSIGSMFIKIYFNVYRRNTKVKSKQHRLMVHSSNFDR